MLDRGIGHVYIRPATPCLNGKVERSHRIDAEEFRRLLDGVDVDDSKLFNEKLADWERFYQLRAYAGSSRGRDPPMGVPLPDVVDVAAAGCRRHVQVRLGVVTITPERRALDALTPSELRQGRALPSDPQALPHEAGAGASLSYTGPARRLRSYYGQRRPHGRLGGRTSLVASTLAPRPGPAAPASFTQLRVRHDKVDIAGGVTLRYLSRLRRINVGRAYRGEAIRILVAGANARIIRESGELLRELTLDDEHRYFGRSVGRVHNDVRQVSAMS